MWSHQARQKRNLITLIWSDSTVTVPLVTFSLTWSRRISLRFLDLRYWSGRTIPKKWTNNLSLKYLIQCRHLYTSLAVEKNVLKLMKDNFFIWHHRESCLFSNGHQCMVSFLFRKLFVLNKGVTRKGKGAQLPGRWITVGAAASLQGVPKIPKIVASTSFNTVHLLPTDLRLEHGAPYLFLAIGAI